MNTKVLEELGLTKGEISVYLALAKLGESTTGPIVEESKISASKVYDILHRLGRKGLVSHIMIEKTKHFKAADPERLNVYLQEKQEMLRAQEPEVQALIEELNNIQGTALTNETAQVYEGMKGLQTARERTIKIMNKGDEMFVLGISNTPYAGPMENYFKHYHKRRYDKGIKCKYLYNEDARKHGKVSAKYPLSEVRYMKEGLITHAWMEIYADTVTIGINKGKSFSVVIQNQEVANSFKIYAKMLWSLGKA